MSGIRLSNVWAREDAYGKGHGSNLWFAPPPGSYISFSYSRSTNEIVTPGSKTFATVAYGGISGSWNWSFNLDYNYMEPLLLAFEGYSVTNNNDGTYTHILAKSNSQRVPSFTVRRKQLNVMVGGPANSDEVEEFVGCVVKSVKFSMQAGSSQISVAMSGSFADVHMTTGTLGSTDYEDYNGDLAEFSCMFIGGPTRNNYVANVDSLSVSIDNGASTIMNTCTPVSQGYNEGVTDYGFNASCYSTNPEVFKKRTFSGGYSVDYSRPKMKNLAPLLEINIATYNKAATDDNCTPQEAIDTATKSVTFTINRCILKSIEWQRGDDSKIMDQLSSVKCGGIWLTIKNDVPNLEESTAHSITSPNPA